MLLMCIETHTPRISCRLLPVFKFSRLPNALTHPRAIGPSAHPQPWPPLLWQLVQIASAGHLDIVEMAGYDNGVTMV